MPPKQTAQVQPPSPSPGPSTSDDRQDMLVIQDLMDTLDQLPPELTRVYSDLNELGAVLYSTLLQLQHKLNQLVDWVQDPSIGPDQRFQLLQEIAEEAARYKLGADDKIRVAGGASEGLMSHQRHITNLLTSSTILQPAPPSPYTQALTLSHIPQQGTSSRRGQLTRAANSPFAGGAGGAGGGGGGGGGRGYNDGGGEGGGRVGDTPTKKKKSRVQQLGREDDESSVGGRDRGRGGGGGSKKRKPANRAPSPADSLASASAFTTSKPVEPRTARQIAAAAAARARQNQRDDGDSDDSEPRRSGLGGVGMQVTPSSDSMMLDRGLGLDFAGGNSRESTLGRSANATPNLGNGSARPGAGGRHRSGGKRGRMDDDEEGESELDEVDRKNGKGGVGSKKVGGDGLEEGETIEGDVDGAVYCTCRQVSFGEMIGCDEADCEVEWYHVACLGFDSTPEGNWICPQCVEKKKRNPKAKKAAKPRRTK